MMTEHWFWLVLTAACVIWYSTITIFVAVKGMKDIRGMLERLAKKSADAGDGSAGG
jgi:hypothetical protein